LEDEHDKPVSTFYIHEILKLTKEKNFGESRWLNAISIHITQEEAILISGLPFVSHLDLVLSFKRNVLPEEKFFQTEKMSTERNDKFDYGNSRAALQQINVIEVFIFKMLKM
jgi:hypothetical protein